MTNRHTRDSTTRSIDRRRFLTTAASGATLAGLAGCSGGGGGEGTGTRGTTTGDTRDVTLEIWLGYYTEGKTKRQYTDEIVSRAESELGLDINVTGVAYEDTETEFQAARAAGDVPHLVEVVTHPGLLAGDAGMVINDLFEGSETATKVSDGIMAGHEIWGQQLTGEEGSFVTWPLGIRPHFPIWRTDWLEQAGLDKSDVDYRAGSLSYRDDLAGIYQQMQETEFGQQEGYYPSTTGMKRSDEEYLSMYISQFGGSLSGVVSEDGTEATIDSDAAREAIRMQFDFLDEGYFHPNAINHGDEESTTLHWSGKLAENSLQDTADSWGTYLEEHPDSMKNLDYAWSVPSTGGSKTTFAWQASLGFIEDAFGSQAEKDAAVEFLDFWVANNQNAVDNAKNLGFVPANPVAIEEEDWFAKTEMHEQFWRGATLKTLTEFDMATIPAVKGATTITYDIPNQMHQRIRQGTSIEEATSMAAEEIQTKLDENQA